VGKPRLHVLLCTAAAAVAAARIATAQTCPSTPLWQFTPTDPTNSHVTQVVSDTKFGQGLGFYGSGDSLRALWNESGLTPVPHTAGTAKSAWAVVSTITNFPSPVRLSNGGEYVFFCAADGYLYKLDVASGLMTALVNTQRPGCSEDEVLASPTLQLYALSTSVFQNAMMTARGHPDDLVIVVTKTGCSDSTRNRVIAYYASDLTTRWSYNMTGVTAEVGYGSEGGALEYATNRITFGTNQTAPFASNTLWRFNTATALATGALAWAVDAGPVRTRPMTQAATGEVYVATTNSIRKYTSANGVLAWQFPATLPSNPGVIFGTPSRIFWVDAIGFFHGIEDGGTQATELWPPLTPDQTTVHFSTAPLVIGGIGKAYLGRNDGTIQQVDLNAGLLETTTPAVFGSQANPGDPAADFSDTNRTTPDRLITVFTGGMVARYCIPWSGTLAVPDRIGVSDAALQQNAPNPFTSATRIELALPFAARVEIDVYDISGHLLRRLTRTELPAGEHTMVWDGVDESGRRVANGVYFYRLRATGEAGQQIERARKLEIMR
jgi:FlgD Ig-like domain